MTMAAFRIDRTRKPPFCDRASVKFAKCQVCRNPSRLFPCWSERLSIAIIGMTNSTSSHSSAGAARPKGAFERFVRRSGAATTGRSG